MKIGLFGNTNNYPFSLATHLRKRGHDVFLVVTDKLLLHRPESIEPDLSNGYPSWILDLSYLSEWDIMNLHPDLVQVLVEFSTCDALLLNVQGPSLLPFVNKPAIALLTGSDLYDYANQNSIAKRLTGSEEYLSSPQGKSDQASLSDFLTRQQLGIQNSIAVRWFPRGAVPDGDHLLDELGIADSKRHFFTLSNVDRLQFKPQPNNSPLRVFCAVRLTCKSLDPSKSISLDDKGIVNIVRGLARFHRETGNLLDIRMVRKGLHVSETINLLNTEGLSEQVTWYPELSLIDYWSEIEKSDIIFDQLGESIPGGPTLDAMSIGRPVIVNCNQMVYGSTGQMPVCQAMTPEEVCSQLIRLVNDPNERNNIAIQARLFTEKYLSNDFQLSLIENLLSRNLNNHSSPNNDHATRLFKYILESRHDSIKDTYYTTMLNIKLSELNKKSSERELELLGYIGNLTYSRKKPFYIRSKRNKIIKTVIMKKPFHRYGGLCWQFSLNDFEHLADNLEFLSRSTLLLFEDDKPLLPPHVANDDIVAFGAGRYSHWGKDLQFSTSDGSDPNTNGRQYKIVIEYFK